MGSASISGFPYGRRMCSRKLACAIRAWQNQILSHDPEKLGNLAMKIVALLCDVIWHNVSWHDMSCILCHDMVYMDIYTVAHRFQ